MQGMLMVSKNPRREVIESKNQKCNAKRKVKINSRDKAGKIEAQYALAFYGGSLKQHLIVLRTTAFRIQMRFLRHSKLKPHT